jgi:predicted nuclease of predicted toxin-antitoxin system
MKFKLDENIGYRGQDLLRQAGHDVSTIVEQKLISAPDTEVIQGKRKKKCAKVWYVTVKIVDSESPISIVLLSVLDLLRISSFLLILALTLGN